MSATTTSGSTTIPSHFATAENIRSWLRRFGRRQAWISFARAFAWSMLSLWVGMWMVIAVDALGLFSDAMRWSLTLANYGLAGMVGIAQGILRPFFHPSEQTLASEVEGSCPELREGLLAFVDLSRPRTGRAPFSSDFMDALQRNVATTLAERSVRELLPWARTRRTTIAALVAWLLVVGMSWIPSIELPQRVRRALIPFMDLERPSFTRIEVIQPARDDVTVPEHQSLECEIRILGQAVETSIMEIRSAKGDGTQPTQRLSMTKIPSAQPQFVSILPVGAEDIEYRFLAGDGQSLWRRVRPQPRPRVAEFHHRIEFPAYTQLPPTDWNAEDGNVSVLTGSETRIGFRPTVPLASATATLERFDSGERQTLDLQWSETHQTWSFGWTAEQDSKFQLKLLAKVLNSQQTIENTYSPTYELSAIPDHAPAVFWEPTDDTLWRIKPKANQSWIVSQEDWIPLAARYADDLPGAALEQQISINRGPWKSLSLPSALHSEEAAKDHGQERDRMAMEWKPLDGVTNPTDMRVRWRFDLLETGARAGDQVSIRLAARDRLDQITYSDPIVFSLAASGFDRRRHDALFLRASLVPALSQLSDLMHTDREKLQPRLQQAIASPDATESHSALAKDMEATVNQWRLEIKKVRGLATAIVARLPRILDQSETEMVVRLLSRLEHEQGTRLILATNALRNLSGPEDSSRAEIRQWIENGISAMSEADDHAARLLDSYRRFVGHDALTAISTDMETARRYQVAQIRKINRGDLETLERSQKILQQYIENTHQLASNLEPFLSIHLQQQFKHFYNVLDHMSSEINDQAQQERSEKQFDVWFEDCKRLETNLGLNAWAFDMDNSLWWNISDTQRDLLQRGMAVPHQMQASIEQWRRARAAAQEQIRSNNDAQLSTQQQRATIAWRMATESAAQLADRKELHQQRNPIDPMFGSDMGLAARAWEFAFEPALASSPASTEEEPLLRDLQGIVRAYRVLEAAHEFQDIREVAVQLQKLEQFDGDSIDGRFTHVKMWDSLNHRIEATHRWMQESQIPDTVANPFNALRWNPTSHRIRSKMDPRRNRSSDRPLSAANDLAQWLEEWKSVETDLKPCVTEARNFLSKFAPTLSQLAARAAQQTRQLQDASRPRASDTSGVEQASANEPSAPFEKSTRSVARLEEALLEFAASQNILNPKQLAIAKDSDRALQWLEQVVPPMGEATRALIEAHRSSSDAATYDQASARAVDSQEKAAHALEVIADHFRQLESMTEEDDARSQEALNRSREALAQASGTETNPLENYDRADQLGEMAKLPPEELLRQLEEELKRNPPMQAELSDLSKQSAEDAVEQLKNASQGEGQIAKNLENADIDRQGSKDRQALELKNMASATERLALGLLEKSAQVVQRMNLPETRNNLNQIAESLQSAARDASGIQSSAPQEEIDAAKNAFLEAVNEAQSELNKVLPKMQDRTEQPNTKDEKQRQVQATEMKSWQSLMRDDSIRRAKEFARERSQWTEQGQRDLQAKENQLQGLMRDRSSRMQELRNQPENSWLQQDLDRLSQAVGETKASVEQAKRKVERLQAMTRQAEERVQQLENAARADLDRPNPMASLAAEQLKATQSELNQIQNRATNASEPPSGPPTPSAQGLTQAEQAQKEIAETVQQTASQLERSARHEARLNHSQSADQLERQASSVRKTEANEVANSQKALEQLAGQAADKEKAHAQSMRESQNPTAASQSDASGGMQQARDAEKALAQRALELQDALKQTANASTSATARRQSQDSEPEKKAQSPKQMARLVDMLDQQIHGAQRSGSQRATSSSPSSSSQQNQDGKGEPSSSADQGDRASSNPASSSESQSSGDSERGQSTSQSQNGLSNKSNGKSGPGSDVEEALRDSAQEIASQLQNERLTKRQNQRSQRSSSKSPSARYGGIPEGQAPITDKPVGDSRLSPVLNEPGEDWGRLRDQRADDAIQGRREVFDPEFSEAIRAYYRALGNTSK